MYTAIAMFVLSNIINFDTLYTITSWRAPHPTNNKTSTVTEKMNAPKLNQFLFSFRNVNSKS